MAHRPTRGTMHNMGDEGAATHTAQANEGRDTMVRATRARPRPRAKEGHNAQHRATRGTNNMDMGDEGGVDHNTGDERGRDTPAWGDEGHDTWHG